MHGHQSHGIFGFVDFNGDEFNRFQFSISVPQAFHYDAPFIWTYH